MAVAHRQAGSGPVQKREVAVVKQEGGAGPCEGVGMSPVERWVGRGSALEGLGCSLGTANSVVTGRRGRLKGEGCLCDKSTS